MGRAPCCDKANVKKGPWSPEEDAKLKSYIEQYGTGGNWIALPQKIGLKRCGKSCRLRWLNYLRPNIKHGGFSEEEDNIICSLYISIGSRWSIIAAQLPGRTDNDIKNYWNTRLKKKLLGKPRKEQQHGGRRGGGCLRQDSKNKAEEGSFIMAPNNANQSPYWPETTMPACPTQDRRVHEDHTSIRKLLIKLGGRFSPEDITIGSDIPIPLGAAHVYNNPMGLLASSSSTTANSFGGDVSSLTLAMPAMESTNYLPTELDEILYGNSMKLGGLDGLYSAGLDMVDGSSGTSSSESLSWNDMSPLVYPTMISNYQGLMQQKQCNLFDEQVHLGSQ